MPIVKNFRTSLNSNAECFSDNAPLPSDNESDYFYLYMYVDQCYLNNNSTVAISHTHVGKYLNALNQLCQDQVGSGRGKSGCTRNEQFVSDITVCYGNSDLDKIHRTRNFGLSLARVWISISCIMLY